MIRKEYNSQALRDHHSLRIEWLLLGEKYQYLYLMLLLGLEMFLLQTVWFMHPGENKFLSSEVKETLPSAMNILQVLWLLHFTSNPEEEEKLNRILF